MKQTVAVFFGGESTEHDISIVTALSSVIRPLSLSKDYTVVPVYISREGKWYTGAELADIRTFTSSSIEAYLQRTKPVTVRIGNGLELIQKNGLRERSIRIDIAFPAMHGTNGEDGSLMGLLQMARIPFVGCTQEASAIAMNKVLAKQVAEAHGISTTPSVSFTATQYTEQKRHYLDQAKSLDLPLFVKPAHLGSSIGITKVLHHEELENAIEVALHYDDTVLVEQGVKNLIEVTVPIMGNQAPQVALVEAPLAKGDDFFDFDTKYIREGGKKASGSKSAQGYSQLPAELPDGLYEAAEKTALAVYSAIGCSGIARVDLLIDATAGQVYFNEVNPLPGSLYAHNWQRAGVSGVALVTRLLQYALERHAAQKKLTRTFRTHFLQQF